VKKDLFSKRLRNNVFRGAVAAILPIAMISPAMGADPVTTPLTFHSLVANPLLSPCLRR
jgi:hypothetical protein